MAAESSLLAKNKAKKQRVLVLGLDGATFDLLNPLVESGQLPHIAKLLNLGTHAELHSTIQPVTAPAWATVLTGTNQGKHGLYDFVRRKPDTYSLQVTNGSDNKGASIFDLASQYGKKVVSINVPYTSPPRLVNGIVVGGPFIPDLTADEVHPSEFYAKLKKIVPNYYITAAYNPTATDPLRDYAAQIQDSVKIRENLCAHLLQNEEWDLFMVVFMEPDEVHHAYWHTLDAVDGTVDAAYADVIPATYRAIDSAIGKLLATADSAIEPDETLNVMIVSDHGAGPLHYMINLNQWLKEGGFLQFSSTASSGMGSVPRRILTGLVDIYKRYLPPAWREVVRRQLGLSRFEKIKGDLESTLLMSKIEWTRTQAYALGAGGNIFINLEGREPNGTVAAGTDFEKMCKQVADHFLLLSNPITGEPLVKHVHRGKDLYNGPYAEQSPDLVIEWHDYGFWGRGRYDSDGPIFEKNNHFEFSQQPLTGSHRPEGVFIATGPSINPASSPRSPHLMDIAPTILTLLGIEPPKHMDGRILHEILTLDETAFLDKNAPQVNPEEGLPIRSAGDSAELSAEDSEKIAARLRSLGYL